MERNSNPLGLSAYDLWERQVTDLLIETMEITNGDAQGIVEARASEIERFWRKGMCPSEVVERIQGLQLMKHNYSPGPWLIAESCKALVIDSTGMKLADCSFSSDANNKRLVKTLKANTKLVAASPALLESCIELLGFIDRNFPNEDGEAIIDARAAIQSALSE